MILISVILFTIGLLGILLRRNVLVFILSIELMLNSSNLLFVYFAKEQGNELGLVFVFFVLVVAAAEAAIGLAIVINQFRKSATVDLDQFDHLREFEI